MIILAAVFVELWCVDDGVHNVCLNVTDMIARLSMTRHNSLGPQIP